jgi:hypothetical protein
MILWELSIKIATHSGRSHKVGAVEVSYNFVEGIHACCDIEIVYLSEVGNATEMLPSRVMLWSIMSHGDFDAADNAGSNLGDKVQGTNCKV